MSIQRAIRRRRARKAGTEWPSRPQYFLPLADGGYVALTNTQGWRRFSASRLRAMFLLSEMRAKIDRRMGRSNPLASV